MSIRSSLKCKKLQVLLLTFLVVPAFGGNEKNYTYLALGESISYGLNPTLLPLTTGAPLPSPDHFVGYPELVAQSLHLFQSKKLVNASCPGETAASFSIPGAVDYGCHSTGPDGEPPFKTWIGLHTNYSGTQLEFAVSELSHNKHINLVTFSIGGNEILILLRACANDPGCVASQLPSVLGSYALNLAGILATLRANYDGTLIMMTYYSPVPALDGVAQALNATMEQVGSPFGVTFADGYGAFKLASQPFQGDACQAGLLVRLSATTCDFHPSLLGQSVLAEAALAAMPQK